MIGREPQVLDIGALRAATPGVATKAYLNNAAAGLMSDAVLAEMVGHLQQEAHLGAYVAAGKAQERVENGYQDAARLLGCSADEIAFTSSNTQGWQTILSSVAFSPGDVILIGEGEWGGNYATLLRLCERTGAVLKIVPSNAAGTICLESLTSHVGQGVKLICLTWVASGNAAIQPVCEVGAIARSAGVPFFLDGAQAVGCLRSRVEEIGCDALTFPGRKWLRGPRGSGVLYVRRAFASQHPAAFVDYLSAPLADGVSRIRGDARQYETAELALATRLGLCRALRDHLALGEALVHERIRCLSQRLRAGLRATVGVRLHDTGEDQAGFVTFSVDGFEAGVIFEHLAASSLIVTVTGRPYTPFDFAERGLEDILRASPHIFNTEDELDRLVDAVKQILSGSGG